MTEVPGQREANVLLTDVFSRKSRLETLSFTEDRQVWSPSIAREEARNDLT